MSADAAPSIPRRLLLTGFEPYDGAERNPSGEVARALDGALVGGFTVTAHVLPVSSARAPQALRAAIDELHPHLLLMLGVWPGRAGFTVERVAVNVCDFPVPDNDGARPVDEPVIVGGPAAFLASIPIRRVLDAWREHSLPGAVSNSAGTYLCNQGFYVALAHAAPDGPAVGFIHIPNLPAESARRNPIEPSLPLETLVEGVQVAIVALAGERSPIVPEP